MGWQSLLHYRQLLSDGRSLDPLAAWLTGAMCPLRRPYYGVAIEAICGGLVEAAASSTLAIRSNYVCVGRDGGGVKWGEGEDCIVKSNGTMLEIRRREHDWRMKRKTTMMMMDGPLIEV